MNVRFGSARGTAREDWQEAGTELPSTAGTPFLPGLSDLFELAIADKPKERLPEYQGLGEAFEAGYVSLVRGEAENAVRRLEEATRKNPVSFVLQLEFGRALSLVGRHGSRPHRAREGLLVAS